MGSKCCLPLRQIHNPLKVASHEGFFFRARPTFYSSFRSNSVDNPIKEFAVDELHWSPRRSEPGEVPGLVLGDAPL
jgi:hypothetical protein